MLTFLVVGMVFFLGQVFFSVFHQFAEIVIEDTTTFPEVERKSAVDSIFDEISILLSKNVGNYVVLFRQRNLLVFALQNIEKLGFSGKRKLFEILEIIVANNMVCRVAQ